MTHYEQGVLVTILGCQLTGISDLAVCAAEAGEAEALVASFVSIKAGGSILTGGAGTGSAVCVRSESASDEYAISIY